MYHLQDNQAQSELLWAAVKKNDINGARELYTQGAASLLHDIAIASPKRLRAIHTGLEIQNSDGWSILHEAAARGHVEIIKFFSTLPELIIFITLPGETNQGMTPLQLAISNGHVKAFQILWDMLNASGHRNEFLASHIQRDKYGWSLLGWSVYSGSADAVDYILSLKLPEMDIKSKTPPPIAAALTKGNVDLIKHLIDIGAEVNLVSERYQTPLLSAVRRGLMDVTQVLVEYGKADLRLRDSRGNTALDVAEKSGQYECAAYLRSMLLKMGDNVTIEGTSNDFSVRAQWFRPRILGSLLSPRASPTAVHIGNRLYIASGQGLAEGTPNPHPDNTDRTAFMEQLAMELYYLELPARDVAMLPPNSPPMHEIMTSAYRRITSSIVDIAAAYTASECASGNTPSNTHSVHSSSEVYNASKKYRIGSKDISMDTVLFQSLKQLPQQWSRNFGSSLIEIDATGYDAYYKPTQVESPGNILASKPVSRTTQIPFAYFEITILEIGQYGYIVAGWSRWTSDIDQHLGWTSMAYGLHGDIGSVFHNSSIGSAYAPRFQKGDVVGCGLDFIRKEVFFTMNGAYLGPSHQGVDTSIQWFPAISMQSPGEKIRANFGESPFWFDFVAPSLTLQTLEVASRAPRHGGHLISVPPDICPTQLGLLHLSERQLALLEPIPPTEIVSAVPKIDSHDSVKVMPKYHWARFPLTRDSRSIEGSHAFWEDLPLHGILSFLNTPTHIFFVTQMEYDEVTVVLNLWGVELRTRAISKLRLPPIKIPREFTHSKVEFSFDTRYLTAWTYSCVDIKRLETPVLLSLLTETNTSQYNDPEIAARCLEWQILTPSGSHPVSSRLFTLPFLPKTTIYFGGFEETAPQNTLEMLDMRNHRPRWTKIRTGGTAPRARFFCNGALVPVQLKTTPQLIDSRTNEEFPEYAFSQPHGHDDEHDYALYVVGGWNGWSSVPDIDVAHLFLPKPTISESLSMFNDISIRCHDGVVVDSSKILLWCRSSFFRSYFDSQDPNIQQINLAEIIPGDEVIATHLRAFITFFTLDSLAKSDIDNVPRFVNTIATICPEHAQRLQDELFSTRITHTSSIATDFLRSTYPECPMSADLKLVPRGESDPSRVVYGHCYLASLRSNVFKTMLTGAFTEARMQDGVRTVVIPADYELIRLLIPAMCMGEVELEAAGDRIIDLFELAHAFQVTLLIEFLENVLCLNIDNDNVTVLEAVAADHSSKKLRDACANFRSGRPLSVGLVS